jgi:hypothetical protein
VCACGEIVIAVGSKSKLSIIPFNIRCSALQAQIARFSKSVALIESSNMQGLFKVNL